MNTPRGFTLIELLIVVAIIAILAGASLSFVTAPAREQARATKDMARERELARACARLIGDAHAAMEIRFTPEPPTLTFSSPIAGSSIAYQLAPNGDLRRARRSGDVAESTGSLQTGVTLVRSVRALDYYSLPDGRARVALTTRAPDRDEPETVRMLDLCAGFAPRPTEGARHE